MNQDVCGILTYFWDWLNFSRRWIDLLVSHLWHTRTDFESPDFSMMVLLGMKPPFYWLKIQVSELFINGKISFDTWVDGCWLNHLTWWFFGIPHRTAHGTGKNHPRFKIVHLKPLQPFNCWDCLCLLVTFIQPKKHCQGIIFVSKTTVKGKMPKIDLVMGPLCFWNPSKCLAKKNSGIPKAPITPPKTTPLEAENEATRKMMLLFKGVIFRFH